MKKLFLRNLRLSGSDVLSLEEKRISLGGYDSYGGCGDDGSGIEWLQCSTGLCVSDLSECPDGSGPCVDGYLLPSGFCTDPY